MTRTAVQRLVRRLAAVAAGLGALAIVETQLHRYYYGQTYRYYDAAEVYWEDQNTLLLYLPHPTLFWSLRPGITMKVSEATRSFGLVESHNVLSEFAWEIRVGPKGFRGPDFPADKPEGEIRVVCFGDSRTIGEGLEEGHTYPARLEAALRRSFRNRPVRVINAGADGWSSHQGLKLLNDGFARYRPDFAVFAFGINDADTDWGVSDRERALRAPAPLVAAQRLFYRSLAFYWTHQRFMHAKAWLRGRTPVGPSGARAAAAVPRVSLPHYAENLRGFIATCRRRDVVPILLVIPPNPYRSRDPQLDSPEELAVLREATEGRDGEERRQSLERLLRSNPGLASARYALASLHRERGDLEQADRLFRQLEEQAAFGRYSGVARAVADAEAAPLVDLTGLYQARRQDQLFIDAVHPNALGADLAARALAERIQAELLAGPDVREARLTPADSES